MRAYSGQKTIATAGTADNLGSLKINGPVAVKALVANTGNVFIGNDGANDVSSANGLQLKAGEIVVFQYVTNMNKVYIDVSVNGEGVSWIALEF